MAGVSRCPSTTTAWPTYRSSDFFARSSLGWTAFSALLPAPGGRTEELGGTSAADAADHRRPKGPSPGGEGFLLHEGRAEPMTMTEKGAASPPGPAAPERRSHVPG